jgi:hypothetical protein
MRRRAGGAVSMIGTVLVTPLVFSVAANLTDGRPIHWWYLAIASAAVASLFLRPVRWAWRRSWLAWRRYKARDITAPVNLRIECPDGQVVPCGALREPQRDADGCQAFLVIPLRDYQMRQGDILTADAMPLDAILHIPDPARHHEHENENNGL